MTRSRGPAVAALLLLGLASACRGPAVGSASAAFVRPSGSAPLRDARELKLAASMDVFVDAKPIEPLAMPSYPARALTGRAGTVTVRVDITVSVDGKVAAVAPDSLDLSSLSRYRQDFFDAVQVAVRAWRFEPAAIERLDPSASGEPVVAGITPVERSYVVAFKFTESGTVSQSISAH